MKRRDFLKASALASAALTLPGIKLARAQGDQTYYMITFVSGIDYWKDCFRGMQDAAEFLGGDGRIYRHAGKTTSLPRRACWRK